MNSKLLTILQHYIAIYILLIPILRYYIIPPNTDLYLLLTFFSAFIFFNSNKKAKIERIQIYSLLFLGWLTLISFHAFFFSEYSSYILPTSRNNFLIFSIAFLCIIFLSASKFDFVFFIKLYRIISFILIAFFIYQVICTLFLHISVIQPLSFLKRTIESERDGVLSYYNYFRFSSLFNEPSHFAQYLSPLPIFYLYGYKGIFEKSLFKALLATLPVLLCVSGTGIVIMGIVWSYYFMANYRSFDTKRVLSFIIIGIVFVLIFLNSTGLNTMVEEMSDANENKTLDRVSRGFLLFHDLPFDKQLFGIGFQNITAASKIYHMKLADVISNGHNEYVCDIASLLLTGGLFGFSYLIYLFGKLFVSGRKMLKNMSLAVLGIFMSEATLGTLTMFYVIMVLSVYFKEKDNEHRLSIVSNNTSV